MNSLRGRLLFTIIGTMWVGGGGWLMHRYPEFFAKINGAFGLKRFTGPRYITFTQRMGILEMTLAALGVLSFIITTALGLNW